MQFAVMKKDVQLIMQSDTNYTEKFFVLWMR